MCACLDMHVRVLTSIIKRYLGLICQLAPLAATVCIRCVCVLYAMHMYLQDTRSACQASRLQQIDNVTERLRRRQQRQGRLRMWLNICVCGVNYGFRCFFDCLFVCFRCAESIDGRTGDEQEDGDGDGDEAEAANGAGVGAAVGVQVGVGVVVVVVQLLLVV